jgi:alkylhydroperoxidase family enzyme
MSESRTHDAQVTLNEIEQELGVGMVPRIFRLLEGNPGLLQHIWGQFRLLVLGGELPRVLKESLGLVVATAARCEYVKAVHLHSLAIQGLAPAALEALRAGSFDAEPLSPTTRAALRFAVKATEMRQGGDAARWEVLRGEAARALGEASQDPGEQVELLATVALFEQICTVANVLGLDPAQP